LFKLFVLWAIIMVHYKLDKYLINQVLIWNIQCVSSNTYLTHFSNGCFIGRCGKIWPSKFKLNHHLIRHTMIHTGEKPSICIECNINGYSEPSGWQHIYVSKNSHTMGYLSIIKSMIKLTTQREFCKLFMATPF